MSILPRVQAKPVVLRERNSFRPRSKGVTWEQSIAAQITKSASRQTYYTIRLLVDRDRVADAFRAYGYFRWVDDMLDQTLTDDDERLAFLARQQALVTCFYRGGTVCASTVEEQLLFALIRADNGQDDRLRSYIDHMFRVMEIDVHRRHEFISQAELNDYSWHLAVAVTDAMHYFIGHNDPIRGGNERYDAVIAAHITHLLRDSFEDTAAGYFNIPTEWAKASEARDLQSEAYRRWVRHRVKLARSYFESGRRHLSNVKSLRCRLAGYAYMARFEGVLDAIEREDYTLRPDYPERKHLSGVLKLAFSTLLRTLFVPIRLVQS